MVFLIYWEESVCLYLEPFHWLPHWQLLVQILILFQVVSVVIIMVLIMILATLHLQQPWFLELSFSALDLQVQKSELSFSVKPAHFIATTMRLAVEWSLWTYFIRPSILMAWRDKWIFYNASSLTKKNRIIDLEKVRHQWGYDGNNSKADKIAGWLQPLADWDLDITHMSWFWKLLQGRYWSKVWSKCPFILYEKHLKSYI